MKILTKILRYSEYVQTRFFYYEPVWTLGKHTRQQCLQERDGKQCLQEREMEGYQACPFLLSVSLFIHVCGHQSLAKFGF